jgi:hypothetical protein
LRACKGSDEKVEDEDEESLAKGNAANTREGSTDMDKGDTEVKSAESQ